ncbi:LOW QUALITY PROTEIN: HRDC domain-containing protein/DNA_pol_A_exo1 domain-containing protein, partial [Cephalotus follicularis]
EKLSALNFVDKDVGDVEPIPPLSIDCTPFKLVEEVKDLKELAAKLRSVNEFAVDLEHNQYRSFQGLTCLMQISTRTEDYVVDTLKLRIHIGPYLRELFKDPTKRKVMHGADRDIVWLQRDFGIYLCNLFDTGQASRVLKLERNSLEYLLQHFCGVTANKEQNADWRLRPLPNEMIRYAREDTHYLLYIYDLMKIKLLSLSKESEHFDDPLGEVYKRSYDICMQLYEKELLTENSYLYIYGLQGAGFNAQQLSVVAGLCEWRDVVARAEDESTGYILPNKTLIEIAKQMPVTANKLRRVLKTKHPYVERNLGSVVSIIRHSMQNAAAFEAVAQQLKEERLGMVRRIFSINDGFEVSSLVTSVKLKTISARKESTVDGHSINSDLTALLPCSSLTKEFLNPATVQVLKKPSHAFGALLGNSAPKRKLDTDKKEKDRVKLEQIRSAVNLPLHSFFGQNEQSKAAVEEPSRVLNVSTPITVISDDEELPAVPATGSNLRDIIMLEDSDADESIHGSLETTNTHEDKSEGSTLEMNEDDEPMSLSDLSTSFQECFQSSQDKKKGKTEISKEPGGFLQLKPFDYEAARKQVIFGDGTEEKSGARGSENENAPLNSGGRKKCSTVGRVREGDVSGEFAPGGRRQAFPATGNRSTTFR